MNQGHADTDITVEAANGRTMTINAHCLAACSQHFHRMLFGAQGSKEQSERRVAIARRSSAEHLVATKALRCTAAAWIPHCRVLF